MELVRNPIGKELERMQRILKLLKNMKYRYKLTMLLVAASLVPMAVLVIYSHDRMSNMLRSSEIEDMNSILEQTRSGIDSQIKIYSSLLNYLTYSPEIEELIADKNIDGYDAYVKYTEIADPLLSVPKSYHDEILQIELFSDSIKVKHEYTLIPLKEVEEEWWFELLSDEVQVQWVVNSRQQELAAVRKIYNGQSLEAVLCVTLDYQKIFGPFENIISLEMGGTILDDDGRVIYQKHNFENGLPADIEIYALEDMEKEYAFVTAESKESGWTFYLYKSQRMIADTVSSLFIEEIPLILGCVFIVFVTGVIFTRFFTRKIEALTENMNQVNRGSREVTVFSDTEDEIGVLVNSFRRMMDEINRLIDEVYVNRIARKEFELKALQAQINPHFLYNTLSSINWMAIRSNQKEISKVTLALSTFYRTALSKGEDIVSVGTCIKNIEAYIEIQLILHDYDFSVQWEIDETVSDEKMPKLLLQPIVENALEHGLDLKEDGEKCLQISLGQDEKDVILTVKDNGMGMEQEKAEALITYQAKGYGLKNVNDRICLMYGEDYKIRITSKIGEGTSVQMRIPKRGNRE